MVAEPFHTAKELTDVEVVGMRMRKQQLGNFCRLDTAAHDLVAEFGCHINE